MSQYSLGEIYTGAIKTPTLVGRVEVLHQIMDLIYSQFSTILIYLIGAGGVGKTRLISHVLSEVAKDESLIVASELIDLFHVRNRSIGGLIQELLEVVTPLRDYVKQRAQNSEVDEKLEALNRAEQEGLSTAELLGRRQELTEILIATINRLTAKKRLVIALDTAERLFVTPDLAQQRMGLSEQRPAILAWLLHDFLPKLQNTVILIAGRREPLDLTTEFLKLAQAQTLHFQAIPLRGLNESETLAYFDAIIQGAQATPIATDRMAADTIRQWSLDERRTIFYCLHDGGATANGDEPRIRPILLALAIDHLLVAGRPLRSLVRPLQEAQQLTAAQRRAIEEELSKALVQNLREFHRPADEIILTLGWLRRGADAQLLARLTGLDEDIVAASLRQIKTLSFIKERPADKRIFLHDEMYDLLQRYALERGAPDEQKRIYQILEEYYKALIQQLRTAIENLYRPQADTFAETLPEPGQVRLARAQLQDAIVEDIYYRFRNRADQAFQKYFVYVAEALSTNDEILWALLRTELYSFLAEHDPEEKLENVEGLLRSDVVADSAIRWVMWQWGQDRYPEALELAKKLKDEWYDLIIPGGLLAETHLDIWYAYLSIYAGDDADVETLLQGAIARLLNWSKTHPRSPRWAGILARGYDVLGYFYSRQTQPYKAIVEYAKSIQLRQAIELRSQEANALNNRAFDLAKIGQFHTAISQAVTGLRLREQMGPRVPVGLSVNTLALIELMQFDLAGGLRDAQRAYEIFNRLNSPRGLGLALIALAEAKRRTSVSVTHIQHGRSAQFLEEALTHANAAIEIFSNEVQEPGRKIEALREQGRIYRDWSKLRRERPNMVSPQEKLTGKYASEQLAQQSKTAFEQAVALAPNNPYMLIELKLSLAKLHYYTEFYEGTPNYPQKQAELENGLLAEIEAMLPPDYRTPPPLGATIERAWALVQAARLALTRGNLAFNRWRYEDEKVREPWLYKALEQYTICLAFHAYFSEHIFLEMRQAQDQIYDQFNKLDLSHKKALFTMVGEIEKQYQLGEGLSPMSKFLNERFGMIDDNTIFTLDI